MASNVTSSIVPLLCEGLFSDCVTVFITLVPHALLLLVVGPWVCIKWVQYTTPSTPHWVRYPGHNSRWILTSFLLYMLVLEIVERILVDYRSGLWHVHVHVIGFVAIFAALFTLMLYDFAESCATSKYLLIHLLYWLCVTTAKSLHLTSLYMQGLDGRHIRVWLCAIVLALCIGLLLLDLYVFNVMVSI